MSSFDLTASYWQLELAEESKKFTAFICNNRVYEYNVVAFGIKTSSAAIIRGLGEAVHDLNEFLITFIDDLFVMSENFDEHLNHLNILFNRSKKSNFVRKEITFLGHIISSSGIKPDPDKIMSIKNFKEPRNVRELQAFLGFVNFYTKFVNNYSKHIVPLSY